MNLKLLNILVIAVLFYGCNQLSQDQEPYIVDNLTKVDLKLDTDSMTNSTSKIEALFDLEADSIYVVQSDEQDRQANMLMASYLKRKLNIPDGQDIPIPEIPPPPPPVISGYRLRKPQQDDLSGKFEVVLLQNQVVAQRRQETDDDSIIFQAYAILIKNTTDSLLTLDCDGRRLFIVQQAKDEQGRWQEVEFWSSDNYHGMNDDSIRVVPKSGVMSKTPAFQGDFKTEIRVKLFSGGYLYYSNAIKGSINKNQFKVPQAFKKQEEFRPRYYPLTEKNKNET